MRRAGLGLAAWLAGCQPRAWPEPVVCPSGAPEPGVVVAALVDCDGLELEGGEGARGDVWLANSRFAAVLRNPQDALTLAGVGGGTVVDALPWGDTGEPLGRDRLHEIAPLVAGGGLAVDDWILEPDGLTLFGAVVSLPDRPAETPGIRREIRWRVDPDSAWLTLEGADGLWIHPAGGAEILDGQVLAGDVVYGHDGVIETDLGGALRIDGASGLLIAPANQAWAELADDVVHVSGRAPGASSVLIRRDGEAVARLPVVDDAFDAEVDATATTMEARGSGRAASPAVALAEGAMLLVGAPASVVLEPAWAGRARALAVDWAADDGRSGRLFLGPDGGELTLGEGAHTLVVSAGPAWEPRALRVELRADELLPLGVALDPAFDPGARALVTTSWPADRSRTWRGSDLGAALLAAGAGHDYAVFTAEDEIAEVEEDQDAPGYPALVARDAATLVDRAGAWAVTSWPWDANGGTNAHGVPDIAGLAPEEVVAIAYGGPARDRFVAVDVPWLEAAAVPFAVDPRPGFVALGHPGAAGNGWGAWFTWLDAAVPLSPVGPATWVEVTDPGVLGAVDVERGLILGAVSAGTGPLVTLDVAGSGPGDVAGPPGRDRRYAVTVEVLGGEDLDRVVLVGGGGQVLRDWSGLGPGPLVAALDLQTPWVTAMAWAASGDGWAVSGPVWVDPP